MDTFRVDSVLKTEVGQVAQIQFEVKKDFITQFPEATDVTQFVKGLDISELLSKYKLQEYLHNSKGPALVITYATPEKTATFEEYWVNGEYIVDEEMKNKIKHEGQFQDKFEEILK